MNEINVFDRIEKKILCNFRMLGKCSKKTKTNYSINICVTTTVLFRMVATEMKKEVLKLSTKMKLWKAPQQVLTMHYIIHYSLSSCGAGR